MNRNIKRMLGSACNKHLEHARLFLPTTHSEDYEEKVTSFKPAIRLGFVPMTGGETPGGLYLTLIRDPQEKLLLYFLLGGKAEEIDDGFMDLFTDDEKVVVIGTGLDGKVNFAVGADIYDRQTDQLIYFPFFQSLWGTEDVLRKVFDLAGSTIYAGGD